MSAPLIDFVPLAIFASSILGSWHCAGMCGAIACSSALQGRSHLYHLGRMLAYVTLGICAGFLGEKILSSQLSLLQKLSAVLMGLTLTLVGISFLANRQIKMSQSLAFVFPLLKRTQKHGLLLGLLTGLLPCGWLYSFVTLAIATKSPSQGGLMMFLFWLGTVPALTVMSASMGRLMHLNLQTHARYVRSLTGGLLILAGIYSLFSHFISHTNSL